MIERTDESVAIRQNLVEVGLDLFKEHPVLGHGLGAFGRVSGYGMFAHNNYVEVAINGGIVGLLLYYAVHFGVWRKCQQTRPELAWAASVTIATMLLCDLANVTYYDRMTALMLAVLCASGGATHTSLVAGAKKQFTRDKMVPLRRQVGHGHRARPTSSPP